MNFPVPVFLNRLAAARFVLIFGMLAPFFDKPLGAIVSRLLTWWGDVILKNRWREHGKSIRSRQSLITRYDGLINTSGLRHSPRPMAILVPAPWSWFVPPAWDIVRHWRIPRLVAQCERAIPGPG